MPEEKRDLRSIWSFMDNIAFTQGYADADGIRTRYINAGPKDASVVVMIHGMGGTWENFIGNVAPLSEKFNVYAYDLAGHGYSDKPDKVYDVECHIAQLKGFLKAMNLSRVSLFGLSLGGWVSTKFTIRHPEMVDKLIVMSAWGRPRSPTVETQKSKEGMSKVLEQRLQSVRNPSFEGIDKVFETLIADPEDRMQDLLTLRLRVYQQDGMVTAMKNVFQGISPEYWDKNMLTDEELKSVSRPTMVMACIDNEDSFLKMAHEYKALIPDIEWFEILGASHWPQWETADIVNKAAIRFYTS